MQGIYYLSIVFALLLVSSGFLFSEALADQFIPEWVKYNAEWWAKGLISDDEFIDGTEYLIKKDIMKIPPTIQGAGSDYIEMPEWLKNNAGSWASGQISNNSFVKMIQILINEGLVTVPLSPLLDTDNDGISDAFDSCPYDPQNDIDNDGVCGDVDSCSTRYGRLSNGCPEEFVAESRSSTYADSDGDGIPNISDACPFEYGTLSNGCLDTVESTPEPQCSGTLIILDKSSYPLESDSGFLVTIVSPVANTDPNKIESIRFSTNSATADVTSGTSTPIWESGPNTGVFEYMGGLESHTNIEYKMVRWYTEIAPNTLIVDYFDPCGQKHTDTATIQPASTSPPIDSDNDGISDAFDSCPTVYGTQPDGCPDADSDGDGIRNASDACPTVYGTLSNGCPDTVDPTLCDESYTVQLHQAVYTWTDKAYITIVSPCDNTDPYLVETIGGSGVLTVRTTEGILNNLHLTETGVDTGIFTGNVILTGFTHDADGDGTYDTTPRNAVSIRGSTGYIMANNDDSITVIYDSGYVPVITSSFIHWNMGEVQWLEASYPASGIGVVRIIDPDMNLNPEAVDNFDVDVWSNADAGGISLTVTETNYATGIFEGTVFFTTTNESSGHRLRVAEGNTVTAKYADHTLPYPYSTANDLDITASTSIHGTSVPVDSDGDGIPDAIDACPRDEL